MKHTSKNFKTERDSFEEAIEFQNNSFNPGHYIGAGRVPPTVSAPGNAMPLAIACWLAAVFFLLVGLCLFFSDVTFASSGLIKPDTANKVITLVTFIVLAVLFAVFGFVYRKKAKMYYCSKRMQDAEVIDDDVWQVTCPQCGTVHTVKESKCPNCACDYNP